jgi:hypothetical protein
MKHPDIVVLRKATIYNIVTRLHYTESVLNEKTSRKKHVLPVEKLHDIDIQFEASPKKSLRLSILQCGLAKSTVHDGTKLLLRAYKTIVVYSVCLQIAK